MTTVDTQDDTSAALMASAMDLAEETPAMMAASLDWMSETLTAIYEALDLRGNVALTQAFIDLLTEVERVKSLSTSQTIGVASVGMVATVYKLQRDEALLEVERLTKAVHKLGILRGDP